MHTANALINEASPYLQQHAYNPVHWQAWSADAFEEAKRENKLVLISIGYSACHWCHVMEKESFEDSLVAEIMNKHFVCIKVDREERPDVDEIYMSAVQLMTQQGGWPLNCFALPNGQPIYGGTYFRKNEWIQVLEQLAQAYKTDPNRVQEYGSKLQEALRQMNQLPEQRNEAIDLEIIIKSAEKNFDRRHGGNNGAPKFPMPSNWEFLLDYAHLTTNQELQKHVQLTLSQMSKGGIYDHIGGGFTRYSTDEKWHVPHFEKMLYDNGQLLSLYAKAYRTENSEFYKKICYQIISWLEREMKSETGGYYAALDADSEGEEGKYYVWTREELEDLLNDTELELATQYWSFDKKGYWEDGNYIPVLSEQHEYIYKNNKKELDQIQERLLKHRFQREKPGLDDKQICSWNALLALGYLEAYISFKDKVHLERAENILSFIDKYLYKNRQLQHYYKKGGREDHGFAEDYVFYCKALIKHFELSGNQESYNRARELHQWLEKHLLNEDFWIVDRSQNTDPLLIAQSINRTDNVIPSTNAIYYQNAYYFAIAEGDVAALDRIKSITAKVLSNASSYPPAYYSWCSLHYMLSRDNPQIAIAGENQDQIALELLSNTRFNSLFYRSNKDNSIPFLKGKETEKTTIYVCRDFSCKRPIHSATDALELIKNKD